MYSTLCKKVGTAGQSTSIVMILLGKEYLQQIEEDELSYAMVCKPRVVTMKTNVTDLPEEI